MTISQDVVGEWIGRFRFEEADADTNKAEHTRHSSSKPASHSLLEHDTCPTVKRRRRLKRALSPSERDPESKDVDTATVTEISSEPPPPNVSSSSLTEAVSNRSSVLSPDVSAGSPLSSSDALEKHVEKPGKRQSSTSFSEDDMLRCWESHSNSFVDHFLEALCDASSSNSSGATTKERLRCQVGKGRTSIAQSPKAKADLESVLSEPSSEETRPSSASLKEYQWVGVRWLLALHDHNACGILADEMGLGKTVQTITFLRIAHRTERILEPALILCPATLVDNWVQEICRWAPEFSVLRYQGSQPERRLLIKKFEEQLYDEAQQLETSLSPTSSTTPFHAVVASLQAASNTWDRASFFKRHQFSYVIVDEAHNLKNSDSMLYRHLKKSISSDRRLFLTGSPIQNRIDELQNLLHLLIPDHLAEKDLQVAAQSFFRLHSLSNLSAADEKRAKITFFQHIFSPFILRRLKDEVVQDLPPKVSMIDRCILEGRQKQMYIAELSAASHSTLVKNLVAEAASSGPAEGISVGSHHASTASNTQQQEQQQSLEIQSIVFRLRRICNHPLLYRGYYSEQDAKRIAEYYAQHVEGFRGAPFTRVEQEMSTWSDYELHQALLEVTDPKSPLKGLRLPPSAFLESAKIRRLLDLLDTLLATSDAKVLVFSQFTSYLDVIEETLDVHRPNIVYVRFDGNTPVSERQALIRRFSDKDARISVFLASTKAGGVGLNLTAANTVVLMDQDWNPHNDRQAEDRVHRLGQTRPVTIYRLCCKSTIEESIIKSSQGKLRLDEAFGGNVQSLTAAILKDSFISTENISDAPYTNGTATTTESSTPRIPPVMQAPMPHTPRSSKRSSPAATSKNSNGRKSELPQAVPDPSDSSDRLRSSKASPMKGKAKGAHHTPPLPTRSIPATRHRQAKRSRGKEPAGLSSPTGTAHAVLSEKKTDSISRSTAVTTATQPHLTAYFRQKKKKPVIGH